MGNLYGPVATANYMTVGAMSTPFSTAPDPITLAAALHNYRFDVRVTARRTDLANAIATYEIRADYRTSAAGLVLETLGPYVTADEDTNALNYNATLEVVAGTPSVIRIVVTGPVGHTVTWTGAMSYMTD